MGININGYGCEHRVYVLKENLEADKELTELICDYFLCESRELFERCLEGGVVEIDSDSTRGFWEDGSLPSGYYIDLDRIMRECEDGSFVQFMNESYGVWEMFGKRDGEVVREDVWVDCPLIP